MNVLDYEAVKEHTNILNVAYHLCLEIVYNRGNEYEAICPFCGYNKLSKIPTLSLNILNNKYCCSRCGAGGYSTGLYAKVKEISNSQALKELLERECYSIDKTNLEITPTNTIEDVETRDTIYRDFLGMLKLEIRHKQYLKGLGLLETSIEDGLYRSIPKNYIKRRLICKALSRKYNLCGIPRIFSRSRF